MKKMYKKPIINKVHINTEQMMDSLTVSSGGSEQLNGENSGNTGGMIVGNAPRRVF